MRCSIRASYKVRLSGVCRSSRFDVPRLSLCYFRNFPAKQKDGNYCFDPTFVGRRRKSRDEESSQNRERDY
jgi:hypothetical protein